MKAKLIIGLVLIFISLYFVFYTIWSFNSVGEVGSSAVVVTIISVAIFISFFISGFMLIQNYLGKTK